MPTIKMVSQRNFTLRSTTGHVVHFEANQPTPVPESLYAEALRYNIVPVAERPDLDPDGALNGGRVQITGSLKDALVLGAIDEIVQRNNTEDFGGSRQPKAKAIETLCGIKLAGTELSKYYDTYRELVGSNNPLPTHPNAELVRELNTLTTRKQLLDFGADQNIEPKRMESRNVADLKQFLLTQLVHDRQAEFAASQANKPHSTLVED